MPISAALLLALALAVLPVAAQSQPAFVSFEDMEKAPRPAPSTTISYGPSKSQAIDVFLPKTRGPHPTVIYIHGGCWNSNYSDREESRGLAADLAGRGIAVWSIGYRRANEPGGGYPGTFQDVAVAIDRIRTEANRFNLDLRRTALVGHSAGGHLALWAAGRAKLPVSSLAYAADPFLPKTVISLAGVGNLRAAARFVPVLCGPEILDKLTGKPSADRKEVWNDTSPARLLPNAPAKVLVSGVWDDVVPPYAAMDYYIPVRKNGQDATLVNLPESSHFDMVTPGTSSYAEVVRRIEAALR